MKARIALSLAIALACSTTLLAADTLKPLPTADLSGIDAKLADSVRQQRSKFDKEKAGLTGVALAEAYGDVGAAYARVGSFEVAEVAFASAAQAAPLDSRWPYLGGLIAVARGQYAPAQKGFERAYKLNPDYLPIRMALANSMIRSGELDRARALLDEFVARRKTYTVPFAVLGDIAIRQKRFADAVKLFEAALATDPRATQLYDGLAYAHDQLGDKKAAEAARAKAGDGVPTIDDTIMQPIMPVVDLKLTRPATTPTPTPAQGQQPDNADPRQTAMVEAGFAASAGQFDDARKRLDAALKQYPNDADLLGTYARVEATAGKFDAARARVRAATAATPKEPGAWALQGLIEEAAGDDAAALQAYAKAVAIDRSYGLAGIAAGNIQLRTGKPDEAAKSYRAVLTALPDSTNARARVIATQVLTGQCAAAVKETGDAATRLPRDAGIAELYVRVASTCPTASAEQRKRAFGMAENLYKSPVGGSAQVSEAYALAQAATGRWKDAQETQGAAIFDALNKGANEASLALYRDFYKQFEAKKLPDKPWPAAHPLYKPVPATFATQVPPAVKPTAAAPASVKPAATAKPPIKK